MTNTGRDQECASRLLVHVQNMIEYSEYPWHLRSGFRQLETTLRMSVQKSSALQNLTSRKKATHFMRFVCCVASKMILSSYMYCKRALSAALCGIFDSL